MFFRRSKKDGEEVELLKQVFPELRNLEGRFFNLFLAEIATKVEKWTKEARIELGKRKCYDTYIEAICQSCRNYDEQLSSCKVAPNLGQTWEKSSKGTPANLQHPNTGQWYWCIRECPDYIEKHSLDDFPRKQKSWNNRGRNK